MLRRHRLLVGLAVVALGLCLSATLAPAGNPAAKQEMKVLAGKWVTPGFDPKDLEGLYYRVTFTADGKMKLAEWSALNQVWKESGSSKFTVDPSKKPKAMDLDDQPCCIYEIKGDELTIAWSSGKDRPTSFSDKDIALKVFKRSK